jgi:cyclophilin family peptidyl-prolyl cis-trans isomerase
VIQGGGVGPDYKAKPTQKPIPNEAGNGLKNLRGTVGLARASGRTRVTASST